MMDNYLSMYIHYSLLVWWELSGVIVGHSKTSHLTIRSTSTASIKAAIALSDMHRAGQICIHVYAFKIGQFDCRLCLHSDLIVIRKERQEEKNSLYRTFTDCEYCTRELGVVESVKTTPTYVRSYMQCPLHVGTKNELHAQLNSETMDIVLSYLHTCKLTQTGLMHWVRPLCCMQELGV